jgi:hypothetical protein
MDFGAAITFITWFITILFAALFIMGVDPFYWTDISVTRGVVFFYFLVLVFSTFYFPFFYLFTTLVTHVIIIWGVDLLVGRILAISSYALLLWNGSNLPSAASLIDWESTHLCSSHVCCHPIVIFSNIRLHVVALNL